MIFNIKYYNDMQCILSLSNDNTASHIDVQKSLIATKSLIYM